jgi:hypothetical protein
MTRLEYEQLWAYAAEAREALKLIVNNPRASGLGQHVPLKNLVAIFGAYGLEELPDFIDCFAEHSVGFGSAATDVTRSLQLIIHCFDPNIPDAPKQLAKLDLAVEDLLADRPELAWDMAALKILSKDTTK